AADPVDADAGGDLPIPVVERYAARIHIAHHLAYVLGGERMLEMAVAHARARCICHFRRLQMETGFGEGAERARMVIMQVGDDHILDARGSNSHLRQRCSGGAGDRSTPLPALRLLKAGVDEDRSLAVAD